jgi:hypothetical protein
MSTAVLPSSIIQNLKKIRSEMLEIEEASMDRLRHLDASSMDISVDDVENNKMHQVEQQDSYLIDRHPQIVNGVELFATQKKPSTVDATNPIVSKHEDHEP